MAYSLSSTLASVTRPTVIWKMAVSVFTGVRLLSIGDANGEIQRQSEQQALRLEINSTPGTALVNLSNSK